MTRFRHIVFVLGCLMIVGCGEQSTVAPKRLVEMQPMELDMILVTEVSEWIETIKWMHPTFTFDLAEMAAWFGKPRTDLQIVFYSQHCPGTFDIELFVPRLDSWMQVEHQSRWTGVFCGPFGGRENTRILSDFSVAVTSDLMDDANQLSIRVSPAGGGARIRFTTYAPDYRFTTIGTISAMPYSAMASAGDDIWIYRRFYDSAGEHTDTVYVVDRAGHAVRANHLEGSHIWTMCDDGRDGIWGFELSPPRSFIHLDNGLNKTHEFTFDGSVRSDIAFWDDRIWFVSGEDGSNQIKAVNILESVEAGEAVVDRIFAVSLRDYDFQGLFIEDNTLYGVPHSYNELWRLSFQGDIVGKWPLPVVAVDGVVRDSSSLWILHHGPPEAMTNSTLLSRFKLP